MMTANEASECRATVSDAELVALAAGGDRAAFASLYDRYYGRAFRLAYSMTGQRSSAEDLTQEIFMRVYQRLHSFGGQSSFATWFYRLAVNHSLNYRRRARAAPVQMTEEGDAVCEWLASPAESGETRMLHKQLQAKVHAALLELNAEMRIVVILKDIEGLNYEEIAERLNCSQGTIASRLSRARKQLAKKLKHLKGAF